MVTTTKPQKVSGDQKGVVEMAWDPITRIVGSLGIYTKIDFGQSKVVDCFSTSSIFRGYSIFMKGKDPRERALHHESHLRHLRRQSRDVLVLRAADGVRRDTACTGRADREPG